MLIEVVGEGIAHPPDTRFRELLIGSEFTVAAIAIWDHQAADDRLPPHYFDLMFPMMDRTIRVMQMTIVICKETAIFTSLFFGQERVII